MDSDHVFDVRITSICFDSFLTSYLKWDWYHLDTSQLKCNYSVWSFAGLWNNCRIIQHFASVRDLLSCTTVVHAMVYIP